MESEKSFQIESENKLGSNITLNAIFVRHGERHIGGQSLSETGKKQAEEFGLKMEEKDAIKGYTSPVQRAIETVEKIIENSPHEKKLKTRERIELQIPPFSEEMTKKWREMIKNGEDAVEWYLQYGNDRPDEKTWSPIETAEAFAYIVDKYLRMTDRLYSGSNVDLINGTHSGLPEALLKEIIIREIKGEKVIGFDKISELGGSLKYVEPVEFLISTDANGDKKLKVKFRGQEYEIDGDRLKQLSDSYRDKIKFEY